jgi:hypothetical protein
LARALVSGLQLYEGGPDARIKVTIEGDERDSPTDFAQMKSEKGRGSGHD